MKLFVWFYCSAVLLNLVRCDDESETVKADNKMENEIVTDTAIENMTENSDSLKTSAQVMENEQKMMNLDETESDDNAEMLKSTDKVTRSNNNKKGKSLPFNDDGITMNDSQTGVIKAIEGYIEVPLVYKLLIKVDKPRNTHFVIPDEVPNIDVRTSSFREYVQRGHNVQRYPAYGASDVYNTGVGAVKVTPKVPQYYNNNYDYNSPQSHPQYPQIVQINHPQIPMPPPPIVSDGKFAYIVDQRHINPLEVKQYDPRLSLSF